jgi:hypothetical protein
MDGWRVWKTEPEENVRGARAIASWSEGEESNREKFESRERVSGRGRAGGRGGCVGACCSPECRTEAGVWDGRIRWTDVGRDDEEIDGRRARA